MANDFGQGPKSGAPLERAGPNSIAEGTPDHLTRTNRVACIDLPALPLQLLLRRRPDWRRLPAAVVAEDNPQAPLLWVNSFRNCTTRAAMVTRENWPRTSEGRMVSRSASTGATPPLSQLLHA